MSRPSTSCLHRCCKDVDARDKPGHDGVKGAHSMTRREFLYAAAAAALTRTSGLRRRRRPEGGRARGLSVHPAADRDGDRARTDDRGRGCAEHDLCAARAGRPYEPRRHLAEQRHALWQRLARPHPGSRHRDAARFRQALFLAAADGFLHQQLCRARHAHDGQHGRDVHADRPERRLARARQRSCARRPHASGRWRARWWTDRTTSRPRTRRRPA